MHAVAVIAAIVAGFLVARPLFKWIFDDGDDFWDCVKFSFTPNLFSFFRGQYFDDMKQSLKLSCFCFAIGGAAWLTYRLIDAI